MSLIRASVSRPWHTVLQRHGHAGMGGLSEGLIAHDFEHLIHHPRGDLGSLA